LQQLVKKVLTVKIHLIKESLQFKDQQQATNILRRELLVNQHKKYKNQILMYKKMAI
jgi:hypothetical protein